MNRLKELRKEKGLTQQGLADEIGVHFRTLQNWENGKADIKSDKAQTLADFFGVSVAYLLGYDNDFILQSIIKSAENLKKADIDDYEYLEKLSKANNYVEHYIDNSLKWKKIKLELKRHRLDLILYVQELIEISKNSDTNEADLFINYLTLDDTDKVIAFDLIAKLADKALSEKR